MGLPVTIGRFWIAELMSENGFPVPGMPQVVKLCHVSGDRGRRAGRPRQRAGPPRWAIKRGRQRARCRGTDRRRTGHRQVRARARRRVGRARCRVPGLLGRRRRARHGPAAAAFLDALQVREPSVNARRNTIVGLLRGEIAADRGADVPATLAEQLLALVAEESAVRPVVLVIDDLQWADPASVTLWGRLARTARQAPLLLIGTARPVPHRDDLLALHRLAGDDGRIQLTGLAEPAVADLVAVLAGGRPDGSLLRLAEGAAGNPLYLTELVAALMRGSNLTLTPAGTAALADGTTSAATVQLRFRLHPWPPCPR